MIESHSMELQKKGVFYRALCLQPGMFCGFLNLRISLFCGYNPWNVPKEMQVPLFILRPERGTCMSFQCLNLIAAQSVTRFGSFTLPSISCSQLLLSTLTVINFVHNSFIVSLDYCSCLPIDLPSSSIAPTVLSALQPERSFQNTELIALFP